jgi:hypothetical protein
MAGRRRDERYAPAASWEGTLRVLRDVIVHEEPSGSLVAIAGSPGVVGEALTLDLASGGRVVRLVVRVLDSRPVVLDGGVRHRMRLDVVEWTQWAEKAEKAETGCGAHGEIGPHVV